MVLLFSPTTLQKNQKLTYNQEFRVHFFKFPDVLFVAGPVKYMSAYK